MALSDEDLKKEIIDLAARRDIIAASTRYMSGLDRLDGKLVLSAFHPNAYYDVGIMQCSAEAFVDFVLEFLGSFISTQHLLCQNDIVINGDTASGELYFYAWHRIVEDDTQKDLSVAGRYIDEYERRDGDWRITKRCLVTDWSRTDPASDEYFEKAPGLLRGARHGKDFSQTRDWPDSSG